MNKETMISIMKTYGYELVLDEPWNIMFHGSIVFRNVDNKDTDFTDYRSFKSWSMVEKHLKNLGH